MNQNTNLYPKPTRCLCEFRFQFLRLGIKIWNLRLLLDPQLRPRAWPLYPSLGSKNPKKTQNLNIKPSTCVRPTLNLEHNPDLGWKLNAKTKPTKQFRDD